MRVVVINHVTLDGVMQAPGRADEDTRDGFEHGGWASAAISAPDPDIAEAMGARMAESDGLLLGRRTYEDLLASWNAQGGPFKDALNNAQKYVASTTLVEPLSWPNSTLLEADVIGAARDLKARPGRELHILGSGQLIDTLMRHHLIDAFLLIIHPIVLGHGRRLFTHDGTYTTLELAGAKPTASGVIIATYRSLGQQS
jgi:dihydrofolate reductase